MCVPIELFLVSYSFGCRVSIVHLLPLPLSLHHVFLVLPSKGVPLIVVINFPPLERLVQVNAPDLILLQNNRDGLLEKLYSPMQIHHIHQVTNSPTQLVPHSRL